MGTRVLKTHLSVPSRERDRFSGLFNRPTRYKPGDKVELTNEQEDWLESQGLLEPVGEEKAEGGDSLTPKQKLQAEARELGLDDSGTSAEIQERIDEKKAEQG